MVELHHEMEGSFNTKFYKILYVIVVKLLFFVILRLHTNDQLLNINGVSLVGQSNAEAMETLRRALVHTRSNVQGNISLTIARRTGIFFIIFHRNIYIFNANYIFLILYYR